MASKQTNSKSYINLLNMLAVTHTLAKQLDKPIVTHVLANQLDMLTVTIHWLPNETRFKLPIY